MPDRKRAIERLGRVSYYFKSLLAVGWQGDADIYREHKESVNMAIAMLREQEPAKPREERHEVTIIHVWGHEVEVWSEFYCPHCGAMIAKGKSEHYPRCMWCGGKVKWDAQTD